MVPPTANNVSVSPRVGARETADVRARPDQESPIHTAGAGAHLSDQCQHLCLSSFE